MKLQRDEESTCGIVLIPTLCFMGVVLGVMLLAALLL